jgi:hypothetical protein
MEAANIVNNELQTADEAIFQLGGWAQGLQLLTLKNKLVTKSHKGPWTWTDSLYK